MAKKTIPNISVLSEKASPVAADLIIIEDSEDSNSKKKAQLSNLPSSANDPDAIHDNVAGEIAVITEKLTSTGNDIVVIEDSEDTNNKKRLKLSNLSAGTSTDANAIHVNVSGEISALTAKATPVSADLLVIEDSEDSNSKKKIELSDLPTSGGDVTGDTSSTDNAIARFDGTTGKVIQNSGATIDDSGNIAANNLSGTNTGDQNLSNYFDTTTDTMDDITDGTTYVKTENNYTDAEQTKVGYLSVTQAVDLDQMKTDIAALANGMVYKGDWDASSGSFPGGGSAQTGWFYYISVAGTVDGVAFDIGDNVVAITDNASTATYSGNWSKHDQTDAVQSVAGLVGSITASSLRTALNVEDGAEVNNISDANATDLTDSGDSTLHYHASDRDRANHTGTQTANTISDFDTEVSNNTSVAANTVKETNATHTGDATGDGALTINSDLRTVQIDLIIPGSFMNGRSIGNDLLETVNKHLFLWRLRAATLTSFKAIVLTDDSGGTQPSINIEIGGSEALSSDLTLAETWQTGTINTSADDVSTSDRLEITVANTGTNSDAEDLTVSMTWEVTSV